MNWQGLLRALRPAYRRIVVCSRASSEALYRDVCDDFLAHDLRGQPNAHLLCDLKNPTALQKLLSKVPADCDHLMPLRFVPQAVQAFERLGDACACADAPEVLIHARGRSDTPGRNWPVGNWQRLITALAAAGFRAGSIGLSRDTLPVRGVADYRDRPLAETLDRIAAAKLVVGPSSGPMHLASLCATPHLVWTDRRTYSLRRTSRMLYETDWNPLRTRVRVLDAYGFQPPLPGVLEQALAMLEDANHPGNVNGLPGTERIEPKRVQ